MNCPNVQPCACPKTECDNHGKCCDCVVKHRETDTLPYCMFPNQDKSVANYYQVLKERFEQGDKV